MCRLRAKYRYTNADEAFERKTWGGNGVENIEGGARPNGDRRKVFRVDLEAKVSTIAEEGRAKGV